MSDWQLIYNNFDPRHEGVREALCTLGNGFFATRGAAEHVYADEIHYPGTYLAGGYNRLSTAIAGQVVENEDLVNMPNWLPLTFRMPGEDWFSIAEVDILAYQQVLDMQQGILCRTFRFRDNKGRITRWQSRRLVHMEQYHLAAIQLELIAENWSGTIEVRSSLDGTVVNAGVKRYQALNHKHLEPLQMEFLGDDVSLLKVRTVQSRLEVSMAARTQFFESNKQYYPESKEVEEPAGLIGHIFTVELAQESALTIEKAVAIYTSRDSAISESALEALARAQNAPRFDELLRSSRAVWDYLWRQFDMKIVCCGEIETENPSLILRLHIFHLLQTVSLNTIDLDVGVPARGWHGEAYRGHIFWDELFIFPLLNLHIPEITRALLRYRYRRLDAARRAAQAQGYQGAMYPWQSGSDGREESQRVHLNPRSGRWVPDNTYLQRHVSADIAYNAWQYYQVTRDVEFMSFYGGEMILEIARFWASISTYDERLERYEIRHVMGPDEYHDAYPNADQPGLHNNAYTNIMAVWVLCRALEVMELLPEFRRNELVRRLKLRDEEFERWRDITKKMRIVFHGDGIISQFEGYDELKEFDWDEYRDRYGDIQRLDRILESEGDSPNKYKVSKQADVLMLFFLFSVPQLINLFERLGYTLDEHMIHKNVDYYLARTSHGSTLSRVVHSWVLADRDRAHSWKLFVQALRSDVEDIQGGTTAEGIHLGAMAGTVDLVQQSYPGIEMRENVLWFNPRLPDEIEKLHMDLRYRGWALAVTITPKELILHARDGDETCLDIGVQGSLYKLSSGESKQIPLAAQTSAPAG